MTHKIPGSPPFEQGRLLRAGIGHRTPTLAATICARGVAAATCDGKASASRDQSARLSGAGPLVPHHALSARIEERVLQTRVRSSASVFGIHALPRFAPVIRASDAGR
jgi:hypothetical protein